MKKRYLLCSTLMISCLLGMNSASAATTSLGEDGPGWGTQSSDTPGTEFNQEDTGSNCAQYPLIIADANIGTYKECTNESGTYYCYTSCHEENGYVHDGGCNCGPQNCGGYTYPTAGIPGCLGVDACTSPQGGTKYKCVECDSGWRLNNNGGCAPKECNKEVFPFSAIPDSCIKETVKECPEHTLTSDLLNYTTKIWYGCVDCKDGWHSDKKGGCDIDTCDETFNLDECPVNAECDACKIGSALTKYKFKNCKPEYEPDENGKCVKNDEPDEPASDDNSKNCEIGDIYYADDSCSSDVIEGKMPIGVVYDTEKRLVMALEHRSLPFGVSHVVGSAQFLNIIESGHSTATGDIESGIDCKANPWIHEGYMDPVCDADGQANTDNIMKVSRERGEVRKAAFYCARLPIGGKKWYLPAPGEMLTWVRDKDILTPQLEKAGFQKQKLMAGEGHVKVTKEVRILNDGIVSLQNQGCKISNIIPDEIDPDTISTATVTCEGDITAKSRKYGNETTKPANDYMLETYDYGNALEYMTSSVVGIDKYLLLFVNGFSSLPKYYASFTRCIFKY